MMKGIWFDGVHSYDDLNLILSSVSIPPATVKTNFVDIPGGDGGVDLTEALGGVNFKDRECSFTFTVFPQDNFEEKKTYISNLLNGKRCKIRLDKDPGYYWTGRCSIDEYASDRNLHKIVVGATVAPYKLKNDMTKNVVYFCGKNLINPETLKTITEGSESAYYENGTVYVKYTSYNSMLAQFERIPVNPENSYTFSYNVIGGDRIVISFFDADGNNISKSASSTGNYLDVYSGRYLAVGDGIKINMSPDVAYIQIGLCAMSAIGEGKFNEYSNIQLEVSEIATEYEPYTPVTDAQEITLTNGRKVVCPSITCSDDNATFNVGGLEFTLSKGTHRVPSFQLQWGTTKVSIKGTGVVNIKYQEGDL